MTTAGQMMELYLLLLEPTDGRASGGGKSKSKPPVSTEALDLKADLEEWFRPSLPSSGALSVWLCGDEFAMWASVWVGRCQALIFDSRPVRPLLGARCLECRCDRVVSESGGWSPAVVHLSEERRVVCRACDWSGDLPNIG